MSETEVQLIPLSAPLDQPESQLSGLTWCGDELILLPQRPKFSSGDSLTRSALYSLNKQQILASLESADGPLEASAEPFNDSGLMAEIFGFDGYEAIVCKGNTLWLAIETKVNNQYFITNIAKADRQKEQQIKVHYEPHSTIESGSGIWNFSDETLLLAPDALIAIHESNGTTEKPMATAISLISGKQKQITMAPVPYRITDATALDEYNRFWVINYLWEGDEHTNNDDDWIAREFPPGQSHKQEDNVERLVEFELTNEGIVRTETAPIYLKHTQENGRNWEGIVRLNDLGFLLVSDEHPKTYFGFVPKSVN